jgi:hypothetical protein
LTRRGAGLSFARAVIPAIRIRSLADARVALGAARALERPVVLASAPAAAGHAGALWWAELVAAARAEFPEVEFSAVLDCGDAAGDVMGAIRCGVGRVSFAGRADVAAKLRAMAEAAGARLLDAPPPALDLRGLADPDAAARVWLREEREDG